MNIVKRGKSSAESMKYITHYDPVCYTLSYQVFSSEHTADMIGDNFLLVCLENKIWQKKHM